MVRKIQDNLNTYLMRMKKDAMPCDCYRKTLNAMRARHFVSHLASVCLEIHNAQSGQKYH